MSRAPAVQARAVLRSLISQEVLVVRTRFFLSCCWHNACAVSCRFDLGLGGGHAKTLFSVFGCAHIFIPCIYNFSYVSGEFDCAVVGDQLCSGWRAAATVAALSG